MLAAVILKYNEKKIFRFGYFITEIPWESEDIQVNDNEMITLLEAKEHCVKVCEKLNILYSVNNISDLFSSIREGDIYNGEITVGKAKYTTIEYIDGVEEREENDFIHDYYSQL